MQFARVSPVFRIAALIISLFAAGIAIASTDSIREGVRHYQRGQAQLLHGKQVKAERSFRRALVEFPDFSDALLGLGHLHMMRRQFEQALELYTRADQAWEPTREVLQQIAVERQGQRMTELQPYRRVVETTSDGETIVTFVPRSTPSPGSVWNRRRELSERPVDLDLYIGNALFELGRREDAAARWRACIEGDPTHSAAHFNLAVALGIGGRIDDALGMLDRAIELGFFVSPQQRQELELVWRNASR